MLRLPELHDGSQTWRLPLSDPGISGMMEALLDVDGQAKCSAIEGILASEPGLVLWSLLRSPRWRENQPQSTSEIAGWLADLGAKVLDWSEDHSPDSHEPDNEASKRWGELAARSVAVAELASLRAADTAEDVERCFLMGLLSDANTWLEAADEPDSETSTGERLCAVPDWLSEFFASLAELRKDAADLNEADGVSQIVARAIQQVPAELSQIADNDSFPSEVTARTMAVLARWAPCSSLRPSTLPRLAERLRRLDELENRFHEVLEHEKLESLKTLAYGASHEINNPLANISTRAQTLIRDEVDPERRQRLAVINSQAFRAYAMIADMMLFARPPGLQPAAVDLTSLLDQVLEELRTDAETQGTELRRVSPDGPVMAIADATYLAVAIRAICSNALEALQGGGTIEAACAAVNPSEHRSDSYVGTNCVHEDFESGVEIRVRDTGPGIPPEVRRHLFDPYYSGREAGRGLGLGLSKAWRLVTEHGGRIDVESREGQGTTFIIQLPSNTCMETPTER